MKVVIDGIKYYRTFRNLFKNSENQYVGYLRRNAIQWLTSQDKQNHLKAIDLYNKMSQDGRHTAKKDEDIRVTWICLQINSKTPIGLCIIDDYKNKFNKVIDRVEKKGNNKDHYDILIYHTDGTTVRCEEKGTKHYSEIINEDTVPYENSVEFYNGPAINFSIAEKYLKIWYDCNVTNNEIKELYDLPEIPTFEDYLSGGPNCMIDPTSEYSRALKQNYRGKHPLKSMNGWGHNAIDYRIKPNNEFMITDEEKKVLLKEVQDIYNNVMNQKDVWLQTTGTIDGSFSYKWFDKIEPKQIVDVDLVKKKDIEFLFKLEDNTSFKGIMRWGKGCGFSCFRMDLK